MNFRKILLPLAILLLAGGGYWYYESSAGPNGPLRSVPVGEAHGIGVGMLAPEFTLQDLNGREVTLHSLLARGRPVVLNFWASWCTSCRAEAPDFARIQREYGHRVTFVGIDEFNSEQAGAAGVQAVKAYVAKYGLGERVLLDQGNQVGNEYLVSALPTTYFLSPDGVIQQYNVGQMDYAGLRQVLNLL